MRTYMCVRAGLTICNDQPNGEDFVPGGLNHCQDFWENVVLQNNFDNELLMSRLREGFFEFLTDDFRGKSLSAPYRPEAFPWAAQPSRIPAEQRRLRARRGADPGETRLSG